MAKTKLPMWNELLATTGIDVYAKYRIYSIDPALAGPVPGSRLIMDHDSAYQVPAGTPGANSTIIDGETVWWAPTSIAYAETQHKTAYENAKPAVGYESIPRTYGRRVRTEVENGIQLGDEIMFWYPYLESNAAPKFAYTTTYSAGDYVRAKNEINMHADLFRCVTPGTTGNSELEWLNDLPHKAVVQTGGVGFVKDDNAEIEAGTPWTVLGNLTAPMSLYPWKVTAFENLSGSFIVEVPFWPGSHNSGSEAGIFNCNVNYMSEIGPEACYFAQSMALSAGIFADGAATTPTLMPYVTTSEPRARSIRLYNYYLHNSTSRGIRFYRMETEATQGRFLVLAKVADHYTLDDKAYEEQEALFLWRQKGIMDESDIDYTFEDQRIHSNRTTLYIGVT